MLPELLEQVDNDARLLVLVNAPQSVTAVAHQVVTDVLGARGRVVGWRDVRDDPRLGAALTSLLGTTAE